MDRIPVCVIEHSPLIRGGLRFFLTDTDFEMVLEYENSEELSLLSTHCALVIYGCERGEPHYGVDIARIKVHFPQAKIVILASCPDSITNLASLMSSVDGYLLKDSNPDILVSSLSLIMAGEKLFPSSILNMFMKSSTNAPVPHQTQDNNNTDTVCDENSLSVREIEIVRHLATGQSNKMIARCLNITEATVKAHLKTILRKTGAENRTQAAVWALRHGLDGQGNEHAQAARQISEREPIVAAS